MCSWASPDGKIVKQILTEGNWGKKPSEGSHCKIRVSNCGSELQIFDNRVTVVGDNDGEIGRALDNSLMSMHEGEISAFTFLLKTNISVTIELVELVFKGFVYEWGVKRKLDMALHYKERGVQFFNLNNNKEAAYKFTKALKILSLIPLDVQQPPEEVEGVSVEEIKMLKASLFNNLSSCYLRSQCWPMVVVFCKKVFSFDSNNVKALYKIGVAYRNEKDFENAEKAFSRVLEVEPSNKAAMEHFNYVRAQLKKAEVEYNTLVKKMFTSNV